MARKEMSGMLLQKELLERLEQLSKKEFVRSACHKGEVLRSPLLVGLGIDLEEVFA